jgi:glutathione S-transferase
MLYLSLARLPFSFRTVNLKIGKQNEPEHLARNRYGKVPVLRHRGLTIVQSNVILSYLAQTTGHFEGKTEQDRWTAREWLDWESDAISNVAKVRHYSRFREVDPAVMAYFRPLAGWRQPDHRRHRLLGPHGVHGRGRHEHRGLAAFAGLVEPVEGDARLRAAV